MSQSGCNHSVRALTKTVGPSTILVFSLALLGLGHPLAEAQGPTQVSGAVTADTTWTADGSPYVVTGTVNVYGSPTDTVTLTIEPGVEVHFNANTKLAIGYGTNKGALNAVGTSQSPILFTSNQTTKTRGYWGRIDFGTAADSALSVMEYVTVEYGGYGNQGEVYFYSSAPTLRNCTIQESSNYGMYVLGAPAAPVLEDATVQSNTNFGVYMAAGSLSLQDVTFTNTEAAYTISMLANTNVTSVGTHSFDKPIELRATTINTDTTWRNLGAAYVPSNSMSVYKNASELSTLTIEPGVEVRFKQYKSLTIGHSSYRGALIAQGTASEPIVFTSDQTTKTPGYWYNLRFEAATDATTVLEHTILEYGGYSSVGMLTANGSSPTIKNSTLRHSGGTYGYGVYVTGAAALPMFDTVSIENCTGAGIYVAGGGLSINELTISGSGGDYAVNMLASTPVTSTGVNSVDKPIFLRYAAISSDLTWHALGVPYVTNSNVSVYKNTTERATLTIEPGVELRMGPSKRIDVGYSSYKGDLIAQGTPSAPIRITSDQEIKTAGYWDSIIFNASSSSSSVLENVVVEYGGSGGQGPIRAYGTPTIKNCSITNSTNYGVFVSGATAFPDLVDNNFISTPTYAVFNQGGNVIDARASFWGDGSGPSGSGPGSGGAISANVMYNPWLESLQNSFFYVGDAAVTRDTFNKHQEDTAVVATLSAPGDWVLTVLDSLSATVKGYTGSGTSVNQAWNGEQEGTTDKVDDGDYTLKLTAIDPATGQSMAPLMARVTVTGGAGDPNAPVGIITSPGPSGVVRAGDSVSIQGTANDANDFVSYRVEYGAGMTRLLGR